MENKVLFFLKTVFVAVGIVLAVASTLAAETDPRGCLDLREKISETGREIDWIDHFLTVAEMTQGESLRQLESLKDLQRRLIRHFIQYGRKGCDWHRMT